MQLKKRFEIHSGCVYERREEALRQQHRMAATSISKRLTNFFRMLRAELQKLPNGFRSQMRLIAENDRPMCQLATPVKPRSRTLNRTEHAAVRIGIGDFIFFREAKPIELIMDRLDLF